MPSRSRARPAASPRLIDRMVHDGCDATPRRLARRMVPPGPDRAGASPRPASAALCSGAGLSRGDAGLDPDAGALADRTPRGAQLSADRAAGADLAAYRPGRGGRPVL